MKRTIMMIFVAATAAALAACSGGGANAKKDDPTANADYHYKLASGYFHADTSEQKARQVHLARMELQQALTYDPEHVPSHYLMGFILMGRRQYSEAIVHFKEVRRLEPTYHEATNNLGVIYLAQERWEDAIELYRGLLDEPMYTSPELAHNNIGWAHYNMRSHRDAIEHFRMAIFLKPDFCLGYNNLGLAQAGMGDLQNAAKSFSFAIERCPSVAYAEPHFHLGQLMKQGGDHERARYHFDQCSQIEPGRSLGEATYGERCREYLSAY